MTKTPGLPDFDSLWNYGKPAETEARFRDLLGAAEASADRGYLAELLTQIARTLGLQRRFDEAHQLLDRVEPMVASGLPRARVRYLLERGRALNSAGRPEESRAPFLEAFETAKGAGQDGLAVDALHMLGIVAKGDESVDWNMKAIAHAEASADPRAKGWLGALYNNMGWTFHDMGRLDDALDLFQRGLAWRTEKGQVRETQIARWAVARCLRSLGRVEAALASQTALRAEIAAAGGEQDGYVHEEIGECLLALGRDGEECRRAFGSAYELLSKDSWLVANEAPRVERLARIAAGGAP